MIDKVMELLMKQFADVMSKDSEYYNNYHIYLSNEQQYVKDKNREKGAIYIVVKFLPASLNFGQTILPITINAIAERNKIEVCQRLMLEFAQTYNLTTNDNQTIKQTYTSPANNSNFNEVFDGFRSLFYMSGTFLMSENTNPYHLYVSGEENEVQCITLGVNFDIQLDSQPFFSTNNFTKSVGMYGTFTINFTTYLTNTNLINKALAVALKDLSKQPDGVNTNFKFDVIFKNGFKIENVSFKLVNFSVQQNLGEMPVASLTFTN